MLKLYSYFRSSASYRVRIALHWKQLDFEYMPVHLVKDGGQQHSEAYRRINPMGHVPALDHDGFVVAESVAIIQYLDAIFPQHRLFPADPQAAATVTQLVEVINSGIQPLQNLKVAKALEGEFGLTTADSQRWIVRWIEDGFRNLERLLERTSGTYSFGGEISAADAFLVPQCFAARRFGVQLENFPVIARIEANATRLEAFKKAHPSAQPDFV
ncbi:MAG: maleylacetoacetate isomerase [Bdellovibrionales bacterium]|nr:maleylacetoacetate isomerase [Bdellovibrionales bacterium]